MDNCGVKTQQAPIMTQLDKLGAAIEQNKTLGHQLEEKLKLVLAPAKPEKNPVEEECTENPSSNLFLALQRQRDKLLEIAQHLNSLLIRIEL